MSLMCMFAAGVGLGGLVGLAIGAGAVIRQVQSGRIVIDGRIYFCRDTGPVVR